MEAQYLQFQVAISIISITSHNITSGATDNSHKEPFTGKLQTQNQIHPYWYNEFVLKGSLRFN